MKVRRASGVREQDLTQRAKELRESVSPLLPRLTPDCPRDRFDRLREDLEEVRAVRDDAKRLDHFRRWGEPMVRSYAGVLHFYLEPKEITVVAFPLPGGDASYAVLSRSTREAEAAVQQCNDPRRLALGYLEWARKGFYFFTGARALWCTGRDPAPPPEFRTSKVADLPYRLLEDPVHHRFECSHLHAGDARPYVQVGWTGAGLDFRVCRKCAKDDRQLLSGVTDGCIVPDPVEEFPVSASLNVRCSAGDACIHARLPELGRGLRKDYTYGKLSDAQLLDAYGRDCDKLLESADQPTFVAAGICYGSDLPRFLDALGGSAVERRALERVLKREPGLFEIDDASASRALEQLWPDHAEEIVGTIVSDPNEAQRWIREARQSPGRVAELLKRAKRKSEEREVLDALPRYQRLASEASYLDSAARAFRIQGAAGAERALMEKLPKEGKERGLAYALLVALDRARHHDWQFSDTEKEFGGALAPLARELLGAAPDRYHAALDRLVQAAGVADWGELSPPEPGPS